MFPRWQLIAYDDGSLRGEDRIRTQEHLEHCADCRQWIADMREVDQILLRDLRAHDENFNHAREAILDRITTSSAHSRCAGYHRHWVSIAAMLLVIFMTVHSVGWRNPIVVGGSSFTHWLSSDRFVGKTYPDAFVTITPTPILVPIGVPGSLPFQLAPVVAPPTQQRTSDDRVFRNGEGFTILVGTDEHPTSSIVQPEDPANALIVGVGGCEVLLTFAQTEAGRAVIEIDWITRDIRHIILILRQPENGVTVEMAQALAMAFIGEDGQKPEQ